MDNLSLTPGSMFLLFWYYSYTDFIFSVISLFQLYSSYSQLLVETHFFVFDSCWFMADDNLLVLLTYGCRVNEILLNRGKFFYTSNVAETLTKRLTFTQIKESGSALDCIWQENWGGNHASPGWTQSDEILNQQTWPWKTSTSRQWRQKYGRNGGPRRGTAQYRRSTLSANVSGMSPQILELVVLKRGQLYVVRAKGDENL